MTGNRHYRQKKVLRQIGRKARARRAAQVLMQGRLLTLDEACDTWRVEPFEIQLAQLELEMRDSA